MPPIAQSAQSGAWPIQQGTPAACSKASKKRSLRIERFHIGTMEVLQKLQKQLAFACANFITSCSSPQTPTLGKGQPFGFGASSSVGQVHDVLYNLVNFVEPTKGAAKSPSAVLLHHEATCKHAGCITSPCVRVPNQISDANVVLLARQQTRGKRHVVPFQQNKSRPIKIQDFTKHISSSFHKISKARLPNPRVISFQGWQLHLL